jgi:hypothetical protein
MNRGHKIMIVRPKVPASAVISAVIDVRNVANRFRETTVSRGLAKRDDMGPTIMDGNISSHYGANGLSIEITAGPHSGDYLRIPLPLPPVILIAPPDCHLKSFR